MFIENQIVTDRVLLRPLLAKDAAKIAKHLVDPRVSRQTVSESLPLNDQDALAWIELSQKRWVKGLQFVMAIEDRSEGEIIGCVSLRIHRRWSGRFGLLGYWLVGNSWGQGFGVEAVEAFVDHCQKSVKLTRLEARVFGDNIASRRVLERIGFHKREKVGIHWSQNGERREILTYTMPITPAIVEVG